VWVCKKKPEGETVRWVCLVRKGNFSRGVVAPRATHRRVEVPSVEQEKALFLKRGDWGAGRKMAEKHGTRKAKLNLSKREGVSERGRNGYSWQAMDKNKNGG